MDGVFADPRLTGPVSSGAAPAAGHTADAVVLASLTAVNDDSSGSASLSARYSLFDLGTGIAVGTPTSSAVVTLPAATKAGAAVSATLNASIAVPDARLWSIPRPYLYVLVSEVVSASGAVLDQVNTTIGFRSLNYTGDDGLFINDNHVKIRGFCDHNDFGGVGMAVPDRVKLFRAQTLRSVGGNGRRMSHNPPEPMMLDIYDRVGAVVMDENRVFGSGLNLVNNMGSLVKRDRNHASVAIWSFCNVSVLARSAPCLLSLGPPFVRSRVTNADGVLSYCPSPSTLPPRGWSRCRWQSPSTKASNPSHLEPA